MILRLVIMALFAGTLLMGCQHYSPNVRYQEPSYHHPARPPAHAPAHGVRKKYSYHYYPDAGFYFDTGRRIYFYLDSRGNWAASANLPHHLRLYLDSRHVRLELGSERPYLQHRYHKKRYPPGQYKKKYKSKQKWKKKKEKGKAKGRKHKDDDRDERYYRDYR